MKFKPVLKFGATGALSVLGARAAETVLGSVMKSPGSIPRLIAQLAGGGAGAWLAMKFVK